MKEEEYYLGLDIGTDSVGYAAADEQYRLCKFKGEPTWGTELFEAAELAEECRVARTARRRLDRRQQRGVLLEELFASEIGKIDPQFFIRRRESALFAEDTQAGVKLFGGDANGITDEEYHNRYPTIHHLIVELMKNDKPHDIRLVYIVCAWLVKHRGHFLFEMADGQAGNFDEVYSSLLKFLEGECKCGLPWDTETESNTLLEIMTAKIGVKGKQKLFNERVYGRKNPPKKPDERFPYSRNAIVILLCGGTAKLQELFGKEKYGKDTITLSMDEESFAAILAKLGDDGELLQKLRAVYDCALLTQTLNGCDCISEAKIKIYEQHKQDLSKLKYFVKKYAPKKKYASIFRDATVVKNQTVANYASYSGNVKSCQPPENFKHANKEMFFKFLLKNLEGLSVEKDDIDTYKEMMERIEQQTFLPKQRESNNRIIPQQLYYAELDCILKNAAKYLPMLSQADENGFSNADKIRSIFRFRIPYYVGPLNRASKNSWLKRENGKIYPWNFEKMVDLDATEKEFIRRMTNYCTYLPGEAVLPKNSLLYSRYMVLNEINNLTVNGHSIPVEVKQEIVVELFEKSCCKITPKLIREFLLSRGYLEPEDELGGIDITIKSSLKSYHSFYRLLTSNTLNENQVEDIIRHAAYSEDKNRMERWLERKFPQLSKENRRYVLDLKLKEFGRLSAKLLTDIYHTDPETGKKCNIMDMLWQTNNNLMQLLSDRYSFRQQIEVFADDYYSAHPQSLTQRLDDMYISNAVKRPIIQALKITEEVVKAMGRPPKKIFIEMARDSGGDRKVKRTSTRLEQLLQLYKNIKTEEARAFEKELLAMGDMANNRLQGDKLFLYFLQMGRCAYTNEPIELSQLATKTYDIDHIYPQSKVQDDSILNNRVLCLSSVNGAKSEQYPVNSDIQKKMRSFWKLLYKNGLMEKEKLYRLTRTTTFTDDELHQFINRQLVETRQSTKVTAQLLRERYPDTEIVYVKAGLVSRFRQKFDLLKSRDVNALHHAKDAYLNIAVGNVYHERFTKRWFDVRQNYSLKVDTLFKNPVISDGKTVWRGEEDIALVKKMAAKNAVHLTHYAFCRKGGLFDQQPVKAGNDLVPRKKNLPAEKYGGYNKTTASFFMLASYTINGKKDAIFVPIKLMYADKLMTDEAFAAKYVSAEISAINGGKPVEDVRLLLGGRKIKINTIIEADGMRMVLKGKANGGSNVIVSPCMPLVLGGEMERYVKRLEAFEQKRRDKLDIIPDSEHDHITAKENLALYDILSGKLTDSVFAKCPGSEKIAQTLAAEREKFVAIKTEAQITCLLNLVKWFGAAQTCDLRSIDGKENVGSKSKSSRLSSWKKSYTDVRIIDSSAAGLFESRSENLLKLL